MPSRQKKSGIDRPFSSHMQNLSPIPSASDKALHLRKGLALLELV